MPKCCHCGHVGDDVQLESIYVGGCGYMLKYYCEDSKACWRRWEKQQEVGITTDNDKRGAGVKLAPMRSKC
jgi:hypothetical protein